MKKNSKTSVKLIFTIISILTIMFCSISFATVSQTTIDITPPRGKIQIQNKKQIDNNNYVDNANVTFVISAIDDMCEPTEIKYYYSLSPISNTAEITTWYDYTPGKTENVILPNLSEVNTIYAVFKDKAGNTSLIYDDTGYTIRYDKNADDALMFTSTVATTGYYGMPFVVTRQTPKREGYIFAGWSTSPEATEVNFKSGEIIPTDTFIGGGREIPLYAVWLPEMLLADAVEIGDYVNYPVVYSNVFTSGTSYISTHNGWRVISKDIDLNGHPLDGAVNLISAGVPLTYYHADDSSTSLAAITTNFVNTAIDESGTNTYRKSGFLYKSLTRAFTNKFTAMEEDGVTPKVRSIVLDDIFRITNHTTIATGSSMKLADAKWKELFSIGGYYWLASEKSTSNLWHLDNSGNVYYKTGKEYGIRPVVSLKPTVITTGKDFAGAWNIQIIE